jgi:hypothetical protein
MIGPKDFFINKGTLAPQEITSSPLAIKLSI